MGIDPSTMVSLIDQLEAAGLAKRRPHATDRRAREVVITPRAAGSGPGAADVDAGGRRGAQGLTAAERRKLLTLLRRALSFSAAAIVVERRRKGTRDFANALAPCPRSREHMFV